MAGRGGRRAARARRRRRHAAGPAAATSTEQNPTHSLSAVVSPAAFWNSPRGQPAAATAYGATAETAVEGTAGGATASLTAATGAQEAVPLLPPCAGGVMCMYTCMHKQIIEKFIPCSFFALTGVVYHGGVECELMYMPCRRVRRT